MGRRKSVDLVRDIPADSFYGSKVVQKFINVIMNEGKKSLARKIVYGALEVLGKSVSNDKAKTLELLDKVLTNVKPQVEVKARRVGGRVYQVPIQVRPRRAQSLALNWIIESSKKRKGKTMLEKLAKELVDASEGNGESVKKRASVHKMADANRAFSHYVW